MLYGLNTDWSNVPGTGARKRKNMDDLAEKRKMRLSGSALTTRDRIIINLKLSLPTSKWYLEVSSY